MSMARRGTQWLAGAALVIAAAGLAGCHASVQKVQMERVDQEPGGNRGFFVGTAPAATAHAGTREIAELQVELPTAAGRSKRATSSAGAMESSESMAGAAQPSEMTYEPYTVKKGDTLWGIARKFYGNGKLWSRIFDANRDQLSEPGRLRAGMRLQIPRDGQASAAPAASEK